MADGWTEIALFMHGMTPDDHPEVPLEEYRRMREQLVRRWNGNDPFTGESIMPVWNFQPESGPHRPSADVEVVSRNVNTRLKRMEKESKGFNWNPVRLLAKLIGRWSWAKRLYYNGLGDVFYYTSEDGEGEVRREIMEQIVEKLREHDPHGEKSFSMTIFAHSAGSVIAHDMLWHLFSKKREALTDSTTEAALDYIRRTYVKPGKLRIRKLLTSGSPIGPLMIRSRRLIDIMKGKDARLDPADLGLTRQYPADIDPSKPRWINFWDRGDILGAPLADFYDKDRKIVRDEIFTVAIWPPGKEHTGYWLNRRVLDKIADYWR